MNIVHLHPGSDTGGQSMAGKPLLEAAGHEVRVFASTNKVTQRDKLPESRDAFLMSEAVERADVVVIHNDVSVLTDVSGWHGKRLVLHHHGSHFRNNPQVVYAAGEAVGARQVVSTVDLLLSIPEGGSAEWFPQVIDVERMRRIRSETWAPRPRPLVTHAPTNRRIKGTRHVQRAGLILRKEADIVVITHRPWETCLRMKAASDLFVDQLILGYGNNAIEAWAMGLPVISGASPEIIDVMRRIYGGLPFYLTTPAMLPDDIRMMLREPVVSRAWAEEGRMHMERYHAPGAWLRNALSVYGPPEVHAPSPIQHSGLDTGTYAHRMAASA